MKSILKILLPFTIIFIASSSFAQQKVGFINAEVIITAMPEYEEARKQMEVYQKESQETYEAMVKEFTAKRDSYEEKKATLSEGMRTQREAELQGLYQRIEEYPGIIQKDEQELYQKLIAPIQEKVMGSIQKIAKANGFSYVVSTAALMYTDDTLMTDLVPLVKKDLGLQ